MTWIRCSERLPEPWQRAIVTLLLPDAFRAVTRAIFSDERGWLSVDTYAPFIAQVIAWMPDPAPYEGEP